MAVGKYFIEFLGTLFLMYVILVTNNWLAIGLGLAISYFLGAKISGGAFNPAVAIAFYKIGKISQSDLLPYIIVEVLGALSAIYIYTNYIAILVMIIKVCYKYRTIVS